MKILDWQEIQKIHRDASPTVGNILTHPHTSRKLGNSIGNIPPMSPFEGNRGNEKGTFLKKRKMFLS